MCKGTTNKDFNYNNKNKMQEKSCGEENSKKNNVRKEKSKQKW